MAITFILDHRTQEDRRSFEPPSNIPVINVKGNVVQRDRRRLPDRRIANIRVEEVDCYFDDKVFK